MPAAVKSISPEKAAETFGSSCIDLISSALGGKVLSFSDEWFAEASNLINPLPPVRKAGVFVETGAWYDGWETRRHNSKPSDWVIVKLGVSSGLVHGVEVDTAYFNGNHAPAISVSGCLIPEGSDPPSADSDVWVPILPLQECGPSQRHLWELNPPVGSASSPPDPAKAVSTSTMSTKGFSHVKLDMYPDGGIARFRLLGTVIPVFPSDPEAIVDLAHVATGGLVVAASDEHFGKKEYLLLPGRGKDMGDGWETKRSREKGHVDWVVVKLGAPGFVEEIIVDTMHFRGNFPKAVEVYAASAEPQEHVLRAEDERWRKVVDQTECKADTEHAFPSTKLLQTKGKKVTHVKMVIIPDGGVKRLRVFGKKAV